MKVRKYGHEPAQTSSQAKRIGNKPTLFLELFGRTDRRKPINRLQTPLLEISLSLCLNRAANQIKLCRNETAVPLITLHEESRCETRKKGNRILHPYLPQKRLNSASTPAQLPGLDCPTKDPETKEKATGMKFNIRRYLLCSKAH